MTDQEASVKHVFQTMESRVNAEAAAGLTASYGYRITGENGGEWTVTVKDGSVKVIEGLHDPQVVTTASDQDFLALNLGALDAMTAFSAGRIQVEGNMNLLGPAARLFKKYMPPGMEGVEEQREELIRLNQILSIPQTFSTGPIMGKFLKGLKDKRILANVCPQCGRYQVPPREVCAMCRVRVTEFREIGPEGALTIADIAYYASPDPLTGETRETPYAAAHFMLDGCVGGTFWHELNPADIPRARPGARVRPVWAENRTGSINDILHFEIVD
ncbi:MAG: SCP2 sterol-binding domain-containing protein [Proteobacteria bacterium]|nr:SCP2 sterol-binding domain-containing protein [Pseudomonadota bacterium]